MQKKAWTLSELLITTAIVAIIFVVLTPVITRRFEEKISTGAAQNDTRLFTYDTDDTDCTSTSANSLVCKFTPPAGVKTINAILVSGGGGGAGATQAGTINVTKSATSGTKELEITNGMKNVVITYLTGGGGGGGGGAWEEIGKILNCSSKQWYCSMCYKV